MKLTNWLCILSSPLLCGAAPTSNASIHPVYTIANQSLENLAVRSNGRILVTVTTAPNLYSVCPMTGTGNLIHTFPNATGLLGITETKPDIFHAVVGNFSFTDRSAPTSWSIWKIDYANGKLGNAIFSKELDVPGAGFLNGMASFDAERGLLLVADFFKFQVLRIDLMTKTSSVAVADPLLGYVNGVKIRDSELYFSNYFGNFTGRVALDSDGYAKGSATMSAVSSGFEIDDFSLDGEGNIYAASNQNAIIKFDGPEFSTYTQVAAVPGMPTATRFGRTILDRRCLYVTTDAGVLWGVEIGGPGSCPYLSR